MSSFTCRQRVGQRRKETHEGTSITSFLTAALQLVVHTRFQSDDTRAACTDGRIILKGNANELCAGLYAKTTDYVFGVAPVKLHRLRNWATTPDDELISYWAVPLTEEEMELERVKAMKDFILRLRDMNAAGSSAANRVDDALTPDVVKPAAEAGAGAPITSGMGDKDLSVVAQDHEGSCSKVKKPEQQNGVLATEADAVDFVKVPSRQKSQAEVVAEEGELAELKAEGNDLDYDEAEVERMVRFSAAEEIRQRWYRIYEVRIPGGAILATIRTLGASLDHKQFEVFTEHHFNLDDCGGTMKLLSDDIYLTEPMTDRQALLKVLDQAAVYRLKQFSLFKPLSWWPAIMDGLSDSSRRLPASIFEDLKSRYKVFGTLQSAIWSYNHHQLKSAQAIPSLPVHRFSLIADIAEKQQDFGPLLIRKSEYLNFLKETQPQPES